MTDAYVIIEFPGWDLPQNYVGMVFSKWLRSLRYGNDYMRLIRPESYYSAYHAYIKALLSKPAAKVRIAALADDHDVALGFSVSRGVILDYVHVHKEQRGQGIARKLVPDGIQLISHVTRTGLSIWGSKCPEWKFDPFA